MRQVSTQKQIAITNPVHSNMPLHILPGPRSGKVEALLKVAKSSSGAVLSKSATLIEQSGLCSFVATPKTKWDHN